MSNGKDKKPKPDNESGKGYDPFDDYIQYPTKDDFPTAGTEGVLYLDIEKDHDYTWNEVEQDYLRYGGDRPTLPPHNP